MPDDVTTVPAPSAAVPRPPVARDLRAQYRTARLVAAVAGLLGVLLAVATPFLPVKVTEATVTWPQNG